MIAVVCAHPDDAELGAGGLLARAGGVIITLSYGINAQRDKADTMVEAWNAENALGVAQKVLSYDSVPMPNQMVIAQVNGYLTHFGVDTVITHHPQDTHQEHAWTSQIAQAAARNLHKVAFFEGQPPSGQHPFFQPHMYVDISGVREKKYAAIRAYTSQDLSRGLEEKRRRLDAWRGAELGVTAAEVYQVLRWTLEGEK